MIEFDGVNKAFAGQPAVKNLNLHLREGAFSVLIGTSGSGKSTTLKMINRLVEHDSGTIRFAGQDIRQQPCSNCAAEWATPSSPSVCFPTGRWRKTLPPFRSCKSGRGKKRRRGLMN